MAVGVAQTSIDQGLFRRHPRLVWYFAGTELWDRISFQGMQAILTLYLAEQLLLPGRAQHVLLLTPFRHVVERITGPLSTTRWRRRPSASTCRWYLPPRFSAAGSATDSCRGAAP